MPAQLAGFPAWAPALATAGVAYKLDYFARLADLEDANFWFRARNALICWALRKYGPSIESFLEIGCGTGFVIAEIARAFSSASMWGTEISSAALQFAASRVARANLMQMDARAMPFVSEFDAVGIFDVLEHIEEDDAVLAGIHAALSANGIVLITVPQHPSLWSDSDVYWSHVRRYRRQEIEQKVRNAGFHIVRSTSFVAFLLPLMFLSRRRAQQNKRYQPFDELQLHWLLNRLLEVVLGFERVLIKAGVNFPVGGSRLIVAMKRAPDDPLQ